MTYEQDENFRQWVETLPDSHWAKKDLSACRFGWDAGIEHAESPPTSLHEMLLTICAIVMTVLTVIALLML